MNILTGENIIFEAVTPKTVARDLTIPLSLRQIHTLMKEHGVPSGTALQMLEAFGVGVQKYDDNLTEAQHDVIKLEKQQRRTEARPVLLSSDKQDLERLKERIRVRKRDVRADKQVAKFRKEGITARSGMWRRFREDFIEKHPTTRLKSKAYPAARLRFRRALRDAGVNP